MTVEVSFTNSFFLTCDSKGRCDFDLAFDHAFESKMFCSSQGITWKKRVLLEGEPESVLILHASLKRYSSLRVWVDAFHNETLKNHPKGNGWQIGSENL